ncbi:MULTISPECIES: hypothetical protein [unclassified Pseudoalteromonas]|uniref:hypothetical protein n=1 Tax=unclassified Pseudoalteromonas TaxID=194690 RepID=UPI0013FD3DE7|nr:MULTISPECIES: hypothetical protein [unclassified Pseudoalteromonas]MBH0032082.1 hypothetical protein [Pseudoalteromonas sp. SWYJZ98]MCK8096591.1 hypothetical protein [Pseudoalteromonas sp. 1CM17D]
MKKENDSGSRDFVADVAIKSISASTGYKLVKAVSAEAYNPKVIDDWYKEQRKASLDYAKNLVLG